MKYMTFNSSCSYAGVANLLALHGVDTEDRTIALTMKLPFLFAREGEGYLAGPMLQSGAWFDLYLNPLGFHLAERQMPAAAVPAFLSGRGAVMLGLRTDAGKHAVVCTGTRAGRLTFLNNKWEHEPVPEEFTLSEEELLPRLDPVVTAAVLERIPPRAVNLRGKMEQSVPVLRENAADIAALCGRPEEAGRLRALLDPLFRPLLLDGITMLGLVGKDALAGRLSALQKKLLTALRQPAEGPVTLGDWLPAEELFACAQCYIQLIQRELA